MTAPITKERIEKALAFDELSAQQDAADFYRHKPNCTCGGKTVDFKAIACFVEGRQSGHAELTRDLVPLLEVLASFVSGSKCDFTDSFKTSPKCTCPKCRIQLQFEAWLKSREGK